MKRSVDRCCKPFTLLGVCMFLGACHSTGVTGTPNRSTGTRIQGPGVQPHLGFACCDQGIAAMQSLFADPSVLASLQGLHAEIAVAITDFSPERAEVVRRLLRAGIPVIAWIQLSKEEGYYLNADNAPAAAARVAGVEQWTRDSGLKWAAVGLDIEPNFAEFSALRTHRWRLIATVLRNSLGIGRMSRARQAYAAIVAQLESQGYPVQTYQMPYLPAERRVHSSLLDRLLGTVDVRGNEEYLMLYTNNARPVGAAMIWSLGRNAQAISVGSTIGPGTPGSGTGPLDWEELSRDLIVASHFTRNVGVYDLEGCARQGFLPRLLTINWNQSVVIPAKSVQRAEFVGFASRSVLWIASNFLYLLSIGFLFICWILWRRRVRKTKRVART
jgi:hypothetical protein